MRKLRTRAALLLLGIGIAINIVILVRGEEDAAWPLAGIVVLLGAAGASLLAGRREP